MAGVKTEATELSVAFGILNFNNPQLKEYNQIQQYFVDTLTEDKFLRYKNEYPTKQELYSRLINTGEKLRNNYSLFSNIKSLLWTGGSRQAATVATAKDLQVANVPISVKTKSEVVNNPSPYNLFISTPQGSAQASRTPSWYLNVALEEYQNLFSFVNQFDPEQTLELITDFEEQAHRHERKRIAHAIAELDTNSATIFSDLYIKMCHKVAIASSDLFNKNLQNALNSPTKNAVLEGIARTFFRMNALPYILCGIDRKEDFAVLIPELTNWKKGWGFGNIEATPDLNRQQSVVNFHIECINKSTKFRYMAEFHAEVRWSHGKFSQVEAKLYKHFPWNEIPFFSSLI